jgi:hypothetical protein
MYLLTSVGRRGTPRVRDVLHRPFVLRTLGDGRLHFQLISPDGSDRHIWNSSLPLNKWSSFAIGFKLSRSNSGGWVELWYNGVQQTFTNGSTAQK